MHALLMCVFNKFIDWLTIKVTCYFTLLQCNSLQLLYCIVTVTFVTTQHCRSCGCTNSRSNGRTRSSCSYSSRARSRSRRRCWNRSYSRLLYGSSGAALHEPIAVGSRLRVVVALHVVASVRVWPTSDRAHVEVDLDAPASRRHNAVIETGLHAGS